MDAFAFLQGDVTLAGSFENVQVPALDERDDAAEPCAPLFERQSFEFFEQSAPVGGGILVTAGVAGRVDAWRPVQRVDFQTGVVGEAVLLEQVPDGARFLDGVAAEGVVRFGKVARETERGGREHLKTRPQDHLGLFLLVRVVGGKDELHGDCLGEPKIRIKLLFLCVI